MLIKFSKVTMMNFQKLVYINISNECRLDNNEVMTQEYPVSTNRFHLLIRQLEVQE